MTQIRTNVDEKMILLNRDIFISSGCEPPKIPLIFVADGTELDMKSPIMEIRAETVLFSRVIEQKTDTNKKSVGHYIISKRHCKYVDLQSGWVFENNIFHLLELQPDYVNHFVVFRLNDTEVNPLLPENREKQDDITCINRFTGEFFEPTVNNFLELFPDTDIFIGMYIPPESYDFVHIFHLSPVAYSHVFHGNIFNEQNPLATIMNSSSGKLLTQSVGTKENHMECLEISRFVLETLFHLFFR